jgi:hypothetical protein
VNALRHQDEEPATRPAVRPARKWGMRLLIAIAIGVGLGAVGGVMGVRTLEPGNPGTPDSLQMLLDSVANAKVAAGATGDQDRTTAPATVDTAVQAVADSGNVHTVPNLTDLEEGEARKTLEDLGFDVGTVMFRRSPKPVGTVLSTFPIAGERVPLPATVNLILSDGRGPADSLPATTSP